MNAFNLAGFLVFGAGQRMQNAAQNYGGILPMLSATAAAGVGRGR
jgi:hypothetical protein